MIGVAGVAVSLYFAVDMRTSVFCPLILLQHNDAGTLAHDKAAAALVKGCRAAVRVITVRQRHTACKAGHRKFIDGSIGAARNDGIGIPMLNGAEGLSDGVGRGGASGHDRKVRTLCLEFDGDKGRRHIPDHHRNEKGGNAGRALRQQLFSLSEVGCHSADAGSNIGTKPLRLNGADNAAVLYRLYSGRNCILSV
ncbi:hypothetical protein SDC9_85088 [bioreactor metagenome]|uniref:Uncharacterized protein n=1 Tax=bioreactor metagenome TaxID=1076179 RepID=A0A644ZCI8_9ZZZZ